jgi:hypothetical protein
MGTSAVGRLLGGQEVLAMSTEAQVAMLMLRLLIDKPNELQQVLGYLQSQVVIRKAVLDVGKRDVLTREEILKEFEEKFGLIVDMDTDESDHEGSMIASEAISERMIGLPGGAKFRIG